jgi:light-regulated signal transduction histidine kinase (bacteriophytochrome)
MNTLIDDLLSLARTGMVEVKFERVPLVELVDEIKGELAPQIDTRKIEWVVSGLPVVEGERSLLRIALFNLLANAVKYTRKVENARIEIGSGGTRDGFAEIYVRDNGAGFDMMYADKLFGVFQRLHSEREFEGTGVGLALVQRIVLRHGGTIRAHGEPGKGAEFSFTLRVGEESGARVD